MARFACPKCRSVFNAAEEQCGKVFACTSCGKKMRVPAPKSAAVPARPKTMDRTDPIAVPPETPQERVSKRSVPTPAPGKRTRPPAPPEAIETEVLSPEVIEPEPTEIEVVADLEIASAAADEEKPRHESKARPSSMISSAVGGFYALLIIAGLILLLSGRWVDLLQRPIQNFLENQGIHPVFAIAITAAVVLVPLGLFLLNLVKSTILGAMPSDIEFRAVEPNKFEGLDGAKLAELTGAYMSLGFEGLMDYTIEMDVDTGTQAFGRLLVNESDHCFAEINQVFAAGQIVPMRSNIMSLLEDGWSAAVTDRTPVKEGYLMRLPRAVWRSFPDETPQRLMEKHHMLRKAMMRDLKIDVLKDDSAKAYFAREKTNTRARKDAVARRWALGIQIEFWLFDRNRKYEWLGEYRRKAGRISG